MKAYFNCYLTKYTIEATDMDEICYLKEKYHPFLKNCGFRWDQYCTWLDNGIPKLRVIYSTNPQYWGDYVFKNLTNIKF